MVAYVLFEKHIMAFFVNSLKPGYKFVERVTRNTLTEIRATMALYTGLGSS